jgi:predicted metal-dependent peptidase
MTRLNGRDHQRWNAAGDYVINLIVRDAGMILPPTDLLDDRYADWTTDAVYDDLPENPLSNFLKLKPWDGEQDVIENNQIIKDRGAFEAEIQVAVQQAAEAAKAQGKLPANLETIIESITDPKVDWKTVLARFLRANNKSDFSWAKPNRRFIANGMYLPSLHTPALEEIAVAVDTSGSVSDKELELFTSETSHILLDTNPERVHFLQCDTEVCSDEEYTKDNLPLKVTYKGRGGTMFSPVIDYINERYPNVSALVYLTDLGSNDFGVEPNFPVLWVTTDLEEAPYGQVIKI